MGSIRERFPYNTGYIHIPLTITGIPDTIQVGDQQFLLKDEFHISLACTHRLHEYLVDKEYAGSFENFEKQLLNSFYAYAEHTPFEIDGSVFEYHVINRDERKSVVGMIQVTHLAEWFAQFSHEIGYDLPMQPTHITLYTLQFNKGIGVLSQEQLDADGYEIELPELTEIEIMLR